MLDLIDITNDDAGDDVEYAAWKIEGETQARVGQFVRVMWISLAILAVFNSAQLVNVVNGFGVGPVQDTIVAVTATWNEQMERNKLDQPVAVIRNTVLRLHDLQWSELHVSLEQARNAQTLRGPLDTPSPAG
tara:strand:+ start:3267 stop:3662 length:396 start_codon:yes stop_codon:yes gene_type:complete